MARLLRDGTDGRVSNYARSAGEGGKGERRRTVGIPLSPPAASGGNGRREERRRPPRSHRPQPVGLGESVRLAFYVFRSTIQSPSRGKSWARANSSRALPGTTNSGRRRSHARRIASRQLLAAGWPASSPPRRAGGRARARLPAPPADTAAHRCAGWAPDRPAARAAPAAPAPAAIAANRRPRRTSWPDRRPASGRPTSPPASRC